MGIKTDVVIIGAGPVGLFQVFELGLQGLSAHVVDSLPQTGGQCTELYPDKPIYDIPAVPECTGQQLIDNLEKQIAPFSPQIHLDQTVDELQKRGDQDFFIRTSSGNEFDCRAVIIAAGAGSFTPVRVRLPGIDQFENSQMFYRVRDPARHAGKHVVILGGGDSALDWALQLAPTAKTLTLVNRTERFRAAEASVQKLYELAEAGGATVLMGTLKSFGTSGDRLDNLTFTLRDKAGSDKTVPVDDLLVFFGMSPKLGPIEDWDLALERKLIAIDLATFETSVPGIYAIGDINTYEGKKKLILSGFHEAALAAFAIKQAFEPDRKVNLQYTTTSPLMHERLGVDDDGKPLEASKPSGAVSAQ
ncbi:MAG: NAD(P)/FAD-dependent oxidoreductase [Granulosicoccus sp.]|nr:NAD(P)/FAD-dependent oxidoreductase [Granulosicoccus sp.]